MALILYSENESLERIYTILAGGTNPDDDVNELGQMARNEALSRIAQLLEGSLGTATLTYPSLPVASDTVAGIIELADVDEANARYADSVGNRALTPEGHHWAHEFGGMYIATGTSDQSFTGGSWVKITGTFDKSMSDSGDVYLSNETIVPLEASDYFVNYQISWWTWSDSTPKAQVQIFLNGTAQPQTRSSVTFGSSGTVNSISGVGMVDVVTGSYPIDLRVNLSATSTVHIDSAQVTAIKMVGA